MVNATGAVAVPNGQCGMALIAVGHTRGTGSAAAPAGRWLITITNPGKDVAAIDAWIERRDVPGELAGYRPQYGFVDAKPSVFTEQSTLGSLANGKASIVVGALELNAAGAYQVADYSSRGPSLASAGTVGARARPRPGPDVFAGGRRVAAGFFSGTTKELTGTSVAAAHVTGAIASALAHPAISGRGGTAAEALARLAQLRWDAATKVRVAPSLNPSAVLLPGE